MKALMEKLEQLLELGGIKKDVTLLVISGIAVIGSLLNMPLFPFDLAWVAIILCGVPIILEAIIGLVTAFDIKADVLVSLALIAAVCIGQDFAAGEVAFIMQLGGLLEELTVARARAGIEKLVHLTPQTARIIRDGKESVIPAEQVKIGDRIRGLPGESVPVDGTIISGQTSINQAVMTGESLPVDKTVGDSVSSGTVNQFGAFEMEAVKVGEDSSIQRMTCTVWPPLRSSSPNILWARRPSAAARKAVNSWPRRRIFKWSPAGVCVRRSRTGPFWPETRSCCGSTVLKWSPRQRPRPISTRAAPSPTSLWTALLPGFSPCPIRCGRRVPQPLMPCPCWMFSRCC